MANDCWTGSANTCPNCGELLEPGASFCTMCGSPVSAGAPAGTDAGSGVCNVCGAPLDPGASFCIMCGSPVGVAAAPAQAPAAGSGVCPVCGEPLDPGASFCIMCGTPVGGAAPAPVEPPHEIFVDGYFENPDGTQTPFGFTAPDPGYQTIETTPGSATYGYGQPQQPSVPTVHTDDKMADDDDPTVRPKLLMLTYDEARNGCTKQVTIDGQSIEVTIPAGVDVNTKLDIPNYGYFDEMTGARGPLRLTFFLV